MSDADDAPNADELPDGPDRAGPDQRRWWALGALLLLVLGIAAVVVATRDDGADDADAPAGTATTTEPGPAWTATEPTEAYGLEPYAGLGTWVDVFDFAAAYQSEGTVPVVTVRDLDAMAAFGVDTVFLQAARRDDRSPQGLTEPEVLAEWVDHAHDLGMSVVAWYLPTLDDVEADLDRLLALRRFTTARGDRFDGLALDIEDTSTVEDVLQRNRALVELGERLRAEVLPDDVIGAIVLPPTLLEVVNESFWPAFPWRAIDPHYDVWLPMSYWSGRTADSGFANGSAYHIDATFRLRDNLGDPAAIVHGIGGIGDAVSEGELRDFAAALTETRSIGGSIYDYRTLSGGGWAVLRDTVPGAVVPLADATAPPTTTTPATSTTGGG